MKTKLFFAMMLVVVLEVHAQISYINTTTLHTNVATSSGSISMPGITTNQSFTTVSSNYTIGDPLATAFGKVNANFSFISNWMGTNAYGVNSLILTNAGGTYISLDYTTLILNTNGFGGGIGGGGGVTNLVPTNGVSIVIGGTLFLNTNYASGSYLLKSFGAGNDLTISNTFTLVNPAVTEYSLQSIVATNTGLSAANGTYTYSGGGTLTNQNVFVLMLLSTDSVPLIPTMTGYTTPSGVVTNSPLIEYYPSWYAFDFNNLTYWSGPTNPSWVQYQFPVGNIANSYSVSFEGVWYWTLKASNDGTNFVNLDVETQADPTNGTYSIPNSTLYSYYRLCIDSTWPGYTQFGIYSMQLYGHSVTNPFTNIPAVFLGAIFDPTGTYVTNGQSGQMFLSPVWATNVPQAILTVDANSQLDVNGQPIGAATSWQQFISFISTNSATTNLFNWMNISTNILSGLGASNAIANLNGFGTNTTLNGLTIGVPMTNVFFSPTGSVWITNSSHPLVNGQYIADVSPTSYLFTNWVAYLGSHYLASTSANNGLTFIWTNTANTNYQIVEQQALDTAFRNSPMFWMDSLTNTYPYQFPTYGQWNAPLGTWDYWGPSPYDGASGYGLAQSTNVSYTVIFNNRFLPATVYLPFVGNVGTYVVPHNLGYEPWDVKWDIYCQYADAATGWQPGDAQEIGDFIGASAGTAYLVGCQKWKNSYTVGISLSQAIFNTVYPTYGPYMFPKAGNTNSTTAGCAIPNNSTYLANAPGYVEWTNFVFRVRIMP